MPIRYPGCDVALVCVGGARVEIKRAWRSGAAKTAVEHRDRKGYVRNEKNSNI
jgi:hypothetical protein